jgi:WD40 repeat protein
MDDLPLKEPTIRKSFTIQKQDALCGCPYGASEYLATGLSNGTVVLLPTQPQNKVRKWIGHRGPVRCIASCSLQPNLATGSADGTVRLWVGNEQGDSMSLDIGSQEVLSIAVSSKFDKLLVADAGGPPTLWDPRRCAKIGDLEREDTVVNSVSLSSEGLLALTGSACWICAVGRRQMRCQIDCDPMER